MMRILIGGIVWESLTFSPVKGLPDDYTYSRGQDLIAAFNLSPLARELEIELVPTVFAHCKAAGGWSSREAFLSVRDEILEGIRKAGKLDGICLALHGANQVDGGVGCAEEALVLAVRELVGPDMLIAARYDQHANITQPSADALNIITIYRTAPHRDHVSRYQDTLRMLVNAVHKGQKPRSTYIRIPMLIMGERSMSESEPMKSLIPHAVAASKQPGIINADISVGYAWGDLAISGMGVAVSAESEADMPNALRIRDELARAVWSKRYAFEICGEYAPDIDSGIRRALEAPEPCVFMTDTGDNITAGAPGDTTCFLEKLLDHKVPDAVVAGITDPENTRACFESGQGSTVTLTIGGRLDTVYSKPLTITGRITHLFTPVPNSAGATRAATLEGTSGTVRTATLNVGGVILVLTEKPWAFVTLKNFADAGIEPLKHKMVVTKQGYLHSELFDAAPRKYMVLTPGYSPLDLRGLPYQQVIRPIFPLDEFEWDPQTEG